MSDVQKRIIIEDISKKNHPALENPNLERNKSKASSRG